MEKIRKFLKSKIFIIIVCLIVILSLVFGFTIKISNLIEKENICNAGLSIAGVESNSAPKNIVLMIGDGMGKNHIETAKKYYELDSLYMENLAKYEGTISTFSRDNWTTDSAAAATAYSTGIKVNNESVARYNGENIQNMCEYAIGENKKTGIITTTTIYDATPACFSGHADNRYDIEDILNSQLNNNINLFISGQKDNDIVTQEKIEKAKYKYADTYTELLEYSSSIESNIFADFQSISWDEKNANDKTPTLSSVSETALSYLNEISEDDGFFLMIEGADIDTYSHLNNFHSMVQELYGFDQAVKTVVQWAEDRGDTMVIVTADHETGDLRYDDLETVSLNDNLFHSENHTSQDVRVFFYGVVPYSVEHWNRLGQHLDNTQLSRFIRENIYNYKYR